MELYVGNLDHNIDRHDLRDIFSLYGKILSTRIFIDCYTNQRRDFGFVRMATRRGGREAIKGLHGKIDNERSMIVKEVLK